MAPARSPCPPPEEDHRMRFTRRAGLFILAADNMHADMIEILR
jgi:hypothetical protein